MSTAGWSSLPEDLLYRIVPLVDVVDFIRFSAVCTSWRQAALASTPHPPYGRPQIPWLMLSAPANTHRRYFLDLGNHGQVYEIPLPAILGRHCVGSSSDGYLLSVGGNGAVDLRATNPLTGAHIHFPPVPGALSLSLATTQALLSPPPPPSPATPARRAAVVFHSIKPLAFARPGNVGWTVLPSRLSRFVGATFHRGRLYAVDLEGLVSVFDLDSPSFRPSCRGVPMTMMQLQGIMSMGRHLVESPCGDHLFLVIRYGGGGGRHGSPFMSFKVFRLNEQDGYQWKEVPCMGDLAIFLGFHRFDIRGCHQLYRAGAGADEKKLYLLFGPLRPLVHS